MVKKMTECTRISMMLDGGVSKYHDILQGVAQGCTLSPKSIKVSINGLKNALNAVRQGVKVGGRCGIASIVYRSDRQPCSICWCSTQRAASSKVCGLGHIFCLGPSSCTENTFD